MKIKRLISLLIAVLTVLPLAVSCTGGEETGAVTVTPDTTDVITDPETETDGETTGAATDTDEETEAPGTSTDEETAETEMDTGTETEEQTETGTETETDTDAETTLDDGTTAPDTTKEPETTAPETNPPVVTYGKPSELFFRQVFGTGLNNDTPAAYSFIEISNSSVYPVKLKGLTLHSYDVETKKYKSIDLPDVVVPSSSSYLIRCARATGKQGAEYKTLGERLSIAYYDLTWNVVLDNKEIKLCLTDKGKTPSSDLKNGYTYFIGTQSVTTDKNAASGISKNKAAFRRSPSDKYMLVDYKNAPASEIMDRAPKCLKGDLNGLASAGANVVTFSHKAGVYKDSINLTLKAASGYKIYYTLDGSDPKKNGREYLGAIKLSNSDSMAWGNLTKLCKSVMGFSNPSSSKQIGCYVIKAYATNGKTSTQVETNSYFISTKLLGYNTMFISMSLPAGDFIGKENGMYNLQMNDPFGTKMRRTTYTEIFESNGERVSSSYTEIALNGNGSLGFQAKSIRVYFKDDAQPGVIGNPSKLKYDIFKGQAKDNVTEYKRILLRNSGNDSSRSHLRDAYMQRLCKSLNVPIMSYRPTILFINGEMWGVYNARERYDAKYFEEHFGIPEEDFCMLESISPLITGSWNTAYALNDGVEGDEKPFHELVSYIERTDLSKDANFKYVSDRIDIDNIVDFFVGSMYLCNTDWPGNNIKVWRNKNASSKTNDTKWRFAFCDMDMGTGLATDINTNMFVHAINDNTVAGRIFNRMLRNEAFKNKFIDRFYECADKLFDPSVSIPVLEEMYNAVKNVMPLHFTRWPGDGGSTATFESNINSIRYFMNNRKARALAQLEEFFHIQPKQFSVTFDENALTVKVNGSEIKSGYNVSLKNAGKQTISASAKPGYDYTGMKYVNADGKAANYEQAEMTFNIDETVNIIVLAEKKDFRATPSVATGSRAVLALAENGYLYAWGENESGQLGITSHTLTKPTLVFSCVKKAAISMGGTESDSPMTAVLTADGEVYTSGNNGAGQLGRGGKTYSFVKLDLGFKAKDISCGFDHLVIIAENGDMYGVGNNSYGQLGKAGFGGNVAKLQKLDTNVKTAAAGRRHTLYIKENGEMFVLGDNRWNKFKAGAEEKLTDPLKLGDDFRFVSTGQHNCLAINNKNELFYFGWRSVSDFGAGASSGGLAKLTDNIKEAYIQDEHIIMLSTDGKVYGFGLNNYQQISPDGQTKNAPEFIMNNCITCGAGTHYSAAVGSDGTLTLWGNNKCGVIGNGSAADTYTAPYKAIKLK